MMFARRVVESVCIAILVAFAGTAKAGKGETTGGRTMSLTVKSAAFQDGGMIPSDYTCDGKNISPPISWNNVPEGTKSIALICDDPDAPRGTWVHWVVFNLPPEPKKLDENIPPETKLKAGGIHGINDYHRYGYGGPCPPSGTHRYFFMVYALDCVLSLEYGAKKSDLEKAMHGHILENGELVGKYQKK